MASEGSGTGNSLDFEVNVSGPMTQDRVIPLDVGIPVTIRNASSVGFRGAAVWLRDDDTETVGSVSFGRIEPNSTSRQIVPMPGGIELLIFQIFPDVGDPVVGFRLAVNAPAVNITVSD